MVRLAELLVSLSRLNLSELKLVFRFAEFLAVNGFIERLEKRSKNGLEN
ncbi:hypothetical protein ES703_125430 [subsurface metagenome]